MEKAIDIQIYTGPVRDESLPFEEEILRKQAETLESAINSLREKADFAILECLTDIKFPDPKSYEMSIQAWPKGRIFCPLFELRWERIGAKWQGVLAIVSEHELVRKISELGFESYDISECFPSDPRQYFLWDAENPRLGRQLHYECLPESEAHKNKPPLLKVIEYRDRCGYLVFWRFVNMEYEA